MARKAFLIVGVLVVIGVAIGVIVAVTSGGTSTSSTSGADAVTTPAPAPAGPAKNVSDEELLGPGAASGSGGGATEIAKIKEPDSDPEKIKTAFTMLAIGDWGATTDKPGSCCNKYRKTPADSVAYKTDYWAQINVAEILAQSAAAIKPVRIIGHGDNLYWNGAGPKDIAYRMQTTFEDVYNQPALANIPWINVVGNHDLGGSEYICGDVDYQFHECTSVAEMEQYLDLKFTLQQKYVSSQGDRWQLRDHYYVEKFEQGGVSVEIYNVDTNLAESHGVMQICCQCYGYVNKRGLPEAQAKALGATCNDQKPGDALCAGGNVAMYQACYNKIKSWYDMGFNQIQEDLKASKATWKIINSHYSPHFHMEVEKMKAWYKITKDYNVQVWMNGHTHGFNHDIGTWGTHFYENGGGGGIQSETSGHPPEVAEKFVKHAWIAPGNPYGFFELHFSKDWLRTEFVTFDGGWVFSDKKEQRKVSGYTKGHCWHVPVTGGEGRACKA